MSYVEKNLIPGERLLYITGLHWVVLFWPVVIGLLFGLPGVALLIASVAYKSESDSAMAIGGLIAAVIGAIVIFAGVIRKGATEMAVTS